jgi:hypothetical protein
MAMSETTKQTQRERRAAWRAEGKCVECGRPAKRDDGRVYARCERHLANNNRYTEARYHRRRGVVCPKTAGKPEPGGIMSPEFLTRQRAARRRPAKERQ